MRAVVWSSRARKSYEEIIRYYERDDNRVARLISGRIFDAAAGLGVSATGRPSRVAGYYEKLVPRTSYILFYALADRDGRQYVVIADVVHAARNWPRGRMPPR